MKAITVPEPGGPDVLTWAEVPDPECGPGGVVIDVVASAVNRADLLQRQGHYPPPPGASDVLGLECSGTVREGGDGVEGWRVRGPGCWPRSGGGDAQTALVPARHPFPVPPGRGPATAAQQPRAHRT